MIVKSSYFNFLKLFFVEKNLPRSPHIPQHPSLSGSPPLHFISKHHALHPATPFLETNMASSTSEVGSDTPLEKTEHKSRVENILKLNKSFYCYEDINLLQGNKYY